MEFWTCISLQINAYSLMRQFIIFLFWIFPAALMAQQQYRLTPPMIQYPSIFFNQQVLVDLAFAFPNTSIHYTLNQKEPTIKDRVYRKPIPINQHLTTLKAKVFGPPFLPSETISATFIQAGKTIKQIQQSAVHPNYPGSGMETLIDLKGGIPQLGSKTWLGYNTDTVSIRVTLAKAAPIKALLANFFQNESAWIFLPETIIVHWLNQSTGQYELFGLLENKATETSFKNTCVYQIVQSARAVFTNQLSIQLVVKKAMPDWHPSKGEHAWMFIDEIKVY